MYSQFPGGVVDGAENPTICIVTSECVGPFKNGGMGTAMTGLAQTLAAAGFSVTMLNTGTVWYSHAARDEWRERYRKLGIDLRWLTLKDLARISGRLRDCGFGVPYLVYDYLRRNPFDIIHFNDCMGEGLYCVTMKRLGAAFQGSLLFVAHHSPSQWVFELNRYLPDSTMLAACNYAERMSTRCTDILWSPSRYLLDWSKTRGFAHAPQTYVQQYVIPTSAMFQGDSEGSEPVAAQVEGVPTEIIFFGRLEERKGLRLFCNALERLNPLLSERNITITLLGKYGAVGMTDARAYLEQQSCRWKFSWQAITDMGQQEAVAYIRSRPAVAVMASPADNSPCTIYEALTFAIPFIAARTGGIPELIAAEDQDAVLFDNTTAALAAKLERILRDGIRIARPAQPQSMSAARWIGVHRQWRTLLPGKAEGLEASRRICAMIDNGPGLDVTLASLSQILQVHRIVIINRTGAPAPQFGDTVALRVIDLSSDEADAVLEELHDDPEEAVLLLRAGAELDRDGVAGLLEALRYPGPDGLAPAALDGDAADRIIVPPLAGSAAFGFYEGVVLTGGLLIKAECLSRVVRGKPLVAQVEFLGLADFAVTGGLDLWPYAEPVLRYPQGFKPPSPGPGVPERIAAYDQVSPTERYYIAAISYAQATRQDAPMDYRRAIIARLSRLGLAAPLALIQRHVPRPVINAAYRLLEFPLRKLLKP